MCIRDRASSDRLRGLLEVGRAVAHLRRRVMLRNHATSCAVGRSVYSFDASMDSSVTLAPLTGFCSARIELSPGSRHSVLPQPALCLLPCSNKEKQLRAGGDSLSVDVNGFQLHGRGHDCLCADESFEFRLEEGASSLNEVCLLYTSRHHLRRAHQPLEQLERQMPVTPEIGQTLGLLNRPGVSGDCVL